MELVLINPRQRWSLSGNLPRYVDDARGNIPSLGLLYTAAAVEERTEGWNVTLVDMSAGQRLDGCKPDLVGITATTFTLLDVLEAAKEVKEQFGDVPVVVGGIHPTIYPDETAALPNIDCAFVGESEETFPQMIDAITSGQARVVYGSVPDIEMLPMPAYHLLDLHRYYSVIGGYRGLTSMFSSRGCPYSCIFCHRLGKLFRKRPADQVIAEVAHVCAMGVEEVLFYDDTFTVDRQRVIDICEGLMRMQLPRNFRFDIRARVDTVDGELLNYLHGAGCKRIHYGVEASNDRVLAVLRKGITLRQVRDAFAKTQEMGIETLAYFIIGSPTESEHEILNSIRLARELKPDYCHFAVMTPYPATPLYQKGLEEGRYDDYWKEFARNPQVGWEAPYWPELPREVLHNLLDKAYRGFYLSPGFVMREAWKTRSVRQWARKGKSALAMLKLSSPAVAVKKGRAALGLLRR